MKHLLSIAAAAMLFALAGCSSSNKAATVEKSSETYANSFDFVWEASTEELKGNFEIEKSDRAKRTITTGWKVIMSPFSDSGRRDRLVVTLVPSGVGWQAKAAQETQTNSNEKDPLNPKEAKWEDAPNDGGLAARFLQNLDTRLQPDERWRDRLAR
jgi:hypothetical protein